MSSIQTQSPEGDSNDAAQLELGKIAFTSLTIHADGEDRA